MVVDVVHEETDPRTVGVHVQDHDGVCLSLGAAQPWVHLSWPCIVYLWEVLDMLRRTDRRFHDAKEHVFEMLYPEHAQRERMAGALDTEVALDAQGTATVAQLLEDPPSPNEAMQQLFAADEEVAMLKTRLAEVEDRAATHAARIIEERDRWRASHRDGWRHAEARVVDVRDLIRALSDARHSHAKADAPCCTRCGDPLVSSGQLCARSDPKNRQACQAPAEGSGS